MIGAIPSEPCCRALRPQNPRDTRIERKRIRFLLAAAGQMRVHLAHCLRTLGREKRLGALMNESTWRLGGG